MSGLSIILPGEIDGYIQAIRGKNTPLQSPVNEPNTSFVNDGIGKCESEVQIFEETIVGEREVDMVKCDGFTAVDPTSSLRPTDFATKPPNGSLPGPFPPLKSRSADVVEFPDVIGQVPADLHLFDCTEAEEPLMAILTPDDNWVYPANSPSFPIAAPRALSEIEQEIENSWSILHASVPGRLSPFIRERM